MPNIYQLKLLLITEQNNNKIIEYVICPSLCMPWIQLNTYVYFDFGKQNKTNQPTQQQKQVVTKFNTFIHLRCRLHFIP